MRKGIIQSVIPFLAACSVAFASAGCTPGTAADGGEQTLPIVKAVKVADFANSHVIASGKVVADQEIQVVAKMAGRIARVGVEEGAAVKKGQVLAELEDSDYIQQLNQAEAALASARAKLADTRAGARSQEIDRLKSVVEQTQASYSVAEHTFQRMKALYETGAISQADLEQYSLDLERARAGYEQAKAQLELALAGPTSGTVAALQAEVDRLASSVELAKNNLQHTKVIAPIDGIIARRNVDPGEMAQPTVPLFTLVRMDTVQVHVNVPQESINQIRVGSPVTVSINGLGDKSFPGKVEFVSPVAEANSSSFPVKIKVDNREGLLRGGMLAEVSLPQDVSGIKLPAAAVVKKGNNFYVYKLDGDVVRLIQVTAEEVADGVLVKSGLSESDRIVLSPGDNLQDGGKVMVD